MAKNLLQQYFPMIPTRMEVEKLIYASPALHTTFISWNEEQQKEFLDFCIGEHGETTPERLEDLLSLIMKQPVKQTLS